MQRKHKDETLKMNTKLLYRRKRQSCGSLRALKKAHSSVWLLKGFRAFSGTSCCRMRQSEASKRSNIWSFIISFTLCCNDYNASHEEKLKKKIKAFMFILSTFKLLFNHQWCSLRELCSGTTNPFEVASSCPENRLYFKVTAGQCLRVNCNTAPVLTGVRRD